MKPSALIISVGLVATFWFASAPILAAQTTPCSAGTLIKNVSVLKLPFHTDYYYGKYSRPQSDSTMPSQTIVTDLTNAFSIAPDFFVQQLCRLNGIFINPAECKDGDPNNCSLSDQQVVGDSWGFREQPKRFFAPGQTPDPKQDYMRYIATSAGLWGGGNPAPKLDDYETRLLGQLVNWTSINSPKSFKPPVYKAPNADGPENSSAMTVLGALAHEFGHVFWYDTFRPVPGGSYDFNTFCAGTFFVNSWQAVNPPPIWRQFGEPQDQHKAYDVQISRLALSVGRQNFLDAGESLHKIFRRQGHWASLFAGLSPDEDFVETFKFYVMTQVVDHPLRSLPITFTGNENYAHDVWDDLYKNKKSELKRKMDCFDKLFHPNP
jgi:hypothetical protein